MKNTKGFSLIELMIGVAIVGVLVAIAYPSYTNSLVKGNRASAKAVLLDVSQKQGAFLLDNRAYGDQAAIETAMGWPGAQPAEFSRFYTLTVTPDNDPRPTFTARATPIAGTRQDGDGWLQISHTGEKTSEKPNKW